MIIGFLYFERIIGLNIFFFCLDVDEGLGNFNRDEFRVFCFYNLKFMKRKLERNIIHYLYIISRA